MFEENISVFVKIKGVLGGKGEGRKEKGEKEKGEGRKGEGRRGKREERGF